MKKILFFFLIPLCLACSSSEENRSQYIPFQVAPLIQDHMVLQQQTLVNLWGRASSGASIQVEASWGASAQAQSDEQGNWQIQIASPEAGGPFTLTFKADEQEEIIEDVYVGEVWLASGQSNMEMPLLGFPPSDSILNSEDEIAIADFPQIRMFTVKRNLSFSPLDSCEGTWEVCSPQTAQEFSATAYFFARRLYQQLQVPIGIIHSSWGGTPAESWTSQEYVTQVVGFEKVKEDIEAAIPLIDEFNNKIASLDKISLDAKEPAKKYVDLDLKDKAFAKADYDDTQWAEMDLPTLWDQEYLVGFDGAVWFRKEFEFPSDLYPESFKVFLGKIDDMDAVYFNGVKIGGLEEMGFYATEREYNLPENAMRDGKNVLAVRVLDTGGGGGMYGDQKLAIRKAGKDVVDLSGAWKYYPQAIFRNNSFYLFEEDGLNYATLERPPLNLHAHTPSVLYNAMLHPLIPYTIKGAIWYQGESNVGRAEQYQSLFPSMIKSWRAAWGQGDFPFYYVQIAPFNYGEREPGLVAELREAQLLTLKEVNTGMVVTMDIGNPKNIHPANKQDVGQRLALWALAKDYGKTEVVYSGPIYKSLEIKENKAIISFDYTGGGLLMKGNKLTHFEIAGEDGAFYPAEAKIENNQVVVMANQVKVPKAVRYGWAKAAEPNLFNQEGLPASPFRTNP